jgi:hypothetical protein
VVAVQTLQSHYRPFIVRSQGRFMATSTTVEPSANARDGTARVLYRTTDTVSPRDAAAIHDHMV